MEVKDSLKVSLRIPMVGDTKVLANMILSKGLPSRVLVEYQTNLQLLWQACV